MRNSSNIPVGDFAIIDGGRRKRVGLPEAIYGPSKTSDEVVAIAQTMLQRTDGAVLVTRASDVLVSALEKAFGESAGFEVQPATSVEAQYRTVVLRQEPGLDARCTIFTAGTSDLRVAWEAAAVLFALGVEANVVADIGVAGLERTLDAVDNLGDADVVIVVAGMEGALASVIGGLVSQPVVAVPTSTGYGSSFEGLTALMAMTASCAQGVTVVGIDNGFGAACAALRICQPLAALRAARYS